MSLACCLGAGLAHSPVARPPEWASGRPSPIRPPLTRCQVTQQHPAPATPDVLTNQPPSHNPGRAMEGPSRRVHHDSRPAVAGIMGARLFMIFEPTPHLGLGSWANQKSSTLGAQAAPTGKKPLLIGGPLRGPLVVRGFCPVWAVKSPISRRPKKHSSKTQV